MAAPYRDETLPPVNATGLPDTLRQCARSIPRPLQLLKRSTASRASPTFSLPSENLALFMKRTLSARKSRTTFSSVTSRSVIASHDSPARHVVRILLSSAARGSCAAPPAELVAETSVTFVADSFAVVAMLAVRGADHGRCMIRVLLDAPEHLLVADTLLHAYNRYTGRGYPAPQSSRLILHFQFFHDEIGELNSMKRPGG